MLIHWKPVIRKPYIRKRQVQGDWSSILVGLTQDSCFPTFPCSPAYSAKFTSSLAKLSKAEREMPKIRVNSVNPNQVRDHQIKYKNKMDRRPFSYDTEESLIFSFLWYANMIKMPADIILFVNDLFIECDVQYVLDIVTFQDYFLAFIWFSDKTKLITNWQISDIVTILARSRGSHNVRYLLYNCVTYSRFPRLLL